ncbi:MAG: peptidylprolyl isomerase [Clostridia bacterium]|nr:peptidylprolyl isomerase [Clostridia bacterium]
MFEEEIEGVYYISVAMLTKTMTRDETLTRDIRHILFTNEKHGSAEAAKAKAQEMLTTFNAGSGSEAAFAALATENTEDPGSQTTGGLYKGVTQGQMVQSFNDWMFDKNRKKGDTGIVESSYGYHVMYYPGVENAVWQASVKNALVNDVFEADVKELKEKYNVQAKNQDITEKELDY